MKAVISFKSSIDGLQLDSGNSIAEITIVKDNDPNKQYKKFGKVYWERLKSGEEAISFDTDDEGWIDVIPTNSTRPDEETIPLVGTLEPATA